MKPKPHQDVARPNAVSPIFSGSLPVSALSVKTDAQRELFDFADADREAVEAILNQDPFPGDADS